MTDITTIGIGVDSRQVKKGSQDLDNLTKSAKSTANAIDKFGNELKQTDKDMGRFIDKTGRMREANGKLVKGLEKTNETLNKTSKSANVLKGAIAGIASAATLAFAGSVIIKFEDAMLGLKATSNATVKEMEAFEKQARKLGATSVFSATQVGQAQRFLAQAGFDSNEILQSTAATLKLASAGSLGLAEAADIASNVLGGMGLEVDQLGKVVDVLAQAARSSNTDVTQLGNALSKAAPLAAAAGVSIEDTATAIGILSNNGLQAEVAATGLGGIFRQLLNITPKAEEALANYGIKASDVNIETKGLTSVLETLNGVTISAGDAITIFGSEAAAAGLVLGTQIDGFENLAEAVKSAEGAAGEMSSTLSSGVSGSIKSLGSAVDESIIQIGKSGLAGSFGSLVDSTTGVISAYNGMLPEFAEANNLSNEQAQSLENLSAIVLSTAVSAGTLTAAITLYTSRVAIATTATAALNAVTKLNPYVAVASAVATLGIGLATYSATADDVTSVTKKLTKALDDNTLAFKENGEIVGEITEDAIFNTIVKINAEITALELSSAAMKAQILQLNELGDAHKDNQSIIESTNSSILKMTVALGLNEDSLKIAKDRVKQLQYDLSIFGTTVKNNTGYTKKSTKAITSETEEQTAANKAKAEGLSLTKELRTPLEIYEDSLQRINELLDAGAISQETYGRATQKIASDLDDATGVTQKNEDALKAIEDQQQKTFDSWSNNITDLITNTKDLDDILGDLARTLLQKAFVNPLLISVGIQPVGGTAGSLISGAGGGSGAGGIFSGIQNVLGSGGNFGFGGAFNSFATSGFGSSIGLSNTMMDPMSLQSVNTLSNTGSFLQNGLGNFGIGSSLAGFAGSGLASALGFDQGSGIGATAGGAIGTFVGGPIGSAIGSFIGTIADDIFGGSNKPTEFTYSSDSSEERFEGRNAKTIESEFGDLLFKVLRGRENDEEITNAATPLIQGIAALEASIATTFSAEQIEAVRAANAGTRTTSKEFENSAEEFAETRIQSILSQLDPALVALESAADLTGTASLEYVASINAINQSLENGGPILDLFGGNLVDVVGFVEQISAKDEPIAQAFARLQASQTSYYNNFFTEEERRQDVLDAANKELVKLNSELGLSGDSYIDSRKELRAYIEGLNKSTDAGRKALESALSYQNAVIVAEDALKIATEAQEKAAEASLERARKANELAEEARQGVINNSLDLVTSAFANAKRSILSELSDVNKSIAEISNLANLSSSAIRRIRSSDPVTSRIDNERARDIVSRAASGEVFTNQELSTALKDVSKPSEDLYENFTDYQRSFFKTAIDISQIDKGINKQLSAEEQTAQALTQMLDDAQAQIDAINNLNTSVLSVKDALDLFQEAVGNLALSGSNSGTGGDAGGGVAANNIAAITALYTEGLGRAPDQAGLDYWVGELSKPGATFDSVRENFFKAAKENNEQNINPVVSQGSSSQMSANEALIDSLYTIGLGREPDQAGFNYWLSELNAGAAFADIKRMFFEGAVENGEPIVNSFANGGTHNGGLRIVGERGPELELTGPSRIINNSDLMSGLNSGGSNSEHEQKMNVILSKILMFMERSYRLEQKWDVDALNVRVVS